jgi:hypothetical protein
VRFTALLHHVTPTLLEESYYALKREAVPGVDGVTWREYGEDLQARLANLHGRIHRGAYRAQPSKRAWFPKADGCQRPLGIAALEDKIVQKAVKTVLEQIYEEDFLGFSYGFRPKRGTHNALDALWVGLMRRKVNWVLDGICAGGCPQGRSLPQLSNTACAGTALGRRRLQASQDPWLDGIGKAGAVDAILAAQLEDAFIDVDD